jgi:enoyl-[acyl-carrier protein] reductase II
MNFLIDELGLKYPIIQGGMANIATPQLAAAVTNAGGLGLLGTGGWNPEMAEEAILEMKELVGDKPFGVNIMLMNPYAGDIVDLCIKHDIKVVTTGAGSPGSFVEKLHEHGIKLLPVVPSVALAKRMEKLGVDAVIVEGTESGGHVGELTSMALIPQVVDALTIPVIGAGGIASPGQYIAMLALGTIGVQIGTILLATEECPIHENYKQVILGAKDTSTIVTGRAKGAPVRNIKNKMTRQYLKLENTDVDVVELEKLTLGSLRKAVFDGNLDEGSFMAGQVAGQIHEIKTVQEVMDYLTNTDGVLKHIKNVDVKGA